jgi:hypothetical protein
MLNLTAHDLKTKGIAAIEAVLSTQVKAWTGARKVTHKGKISADELDEAR